MTIIYGDSFDDYDEADLRKFSGWELRMKQRTKADQKRIDELMERAVSKIVETPLVNFVGFDLSALTDDEREFLHQFGIEDVALTAAHAQQYDGNGRLIHGVKEDDQQ